MKKVLVCILISASAKAQFFTFGAQANFFPGQRMSFSKPVVLDSSIMYGSDGNKKMFELNKDLVRQKKERVPAFEAYMNYYVNQRHYIGLNFRYLKQHTSIDRNDTREDFYPKIITKAPALGIVYGYRHTRTFINYFTEVGIDVTRYKFEFDDYNSIKYIRENYGNYLNQKNTFVLAHVKAGIKFSVLTLSSRMDFQIADVSNRSNIRKITFTPTLNAGMEFQTAFVGLKRFKTKNDAYVSQLDEEVKYKETLTYPKTLIEGGFGTITTNYTLREKGLLAYNSAGSIVQVRMSDKWSETNMGLFFAGKYAPFKTKRFFVGGSMHAGGLGNKKNIGTAITNSTNNASNSVFSTSADVTFDSNTYLFGFDAGYRFRVFSTSYIEVAPAFAFVSIAENSSGMSYNIKSYFDWYSWKSNKAAGLGLTYKKSHLGISAKYFTGLSDIEKNKRFEKGSFYTITLLMDYNGKY